MIKTEIERKEPSIAESSPETHRVLVVDDEEAICFAYRRLFENERFNFDICDNIETALHIFDKNSYFAVISDVRFAGSDNCDGIHFLSEIRKKQPESKVILVTGYGNDELKSTAAKLGAFHYFEKPVIPSVILNLLRELHLIEDEREFAVC